MILLQSSVSVAANTTNANVLSGFRSSVVPLTSGGAVIAVYFTGSAAGLVASAFVGTRNVIESTSVGTENRFPLVPDDVKATGIPGLPNEQITLSAQNTTAGALTFFFRIEIEEIPRRRR